MSQAAASATNYKKIIAWLLIATLFFVFLYFIRSMLLPFVVGMLTAYFLDPAADKLEKLKLGRSTVTVIITATFFILLALACLLVVPAIIHQCAELITTLPGYIDSLQQKYGPQLQDWLEHIDPTQAETVRNAINTGASSVVRFFGGILAGMFQSGMAVVNLFSLLLITPLVTFYLLRDWDRITTKIDSLLPLSSAPTIRTQLMRIDDTLAGFIRGQLNVCLILGIYYAIGLSLTGLQFGLVIGFATGLLVVLPYIGFLFGFGTAMIVAFIQFGFTIPTAAVVAVFMAGQAIEGSYLTPKLVGDKVGLHPLWVIFGLLAGGALFGLVGVLIAVPVTAVIGVLIRFALERYLQSDLYHGR